jgi:hypothetical protein
MRNDVWYIVLRPKEKSVVSSKWLYKIKHVVDASIKNFKARFVVRGFFQKEGVNYKETFSPVTRYASIQYFVSIASLMRWEIHHMDVKTSFLNGIIEEEVYIQKPYGFEVHGRDSHVCRLNKSFY